MSLRRKGAGIWQEREVGQRGGFQTQSGMLAGIMSRHHGPFMSRVGRPQSGAENTPLAKLEANCISIGSTGCEGSTNWFPLLTAHAVSQTQC